MNPCQEGAVETTQTSRVVTDRIEIRGARTHNLKNVDVDIPHERLTAITGLSGSGKSSLAIDTLFVEGQRQFIESLSLYARQFFQQSTEADVEWIEGLLPTICLDQRRGSTGPRSTVGTVSEVLDFLRVLYARIGQVHCFQCGSPIEQQSPEEICQAIASLPERTKVMILAPVAIRQRGKHADTLHRIRQERLVRVRVDGEVMDIDQVPELSARKMHDIAAVTDRIIVREGIEERLFESVQLAARLGKGRVIASYQLRGETETAGAEPAWNERLFSTEFSCPRCEIAYAEIQPRTFSFNSPYGSCTQCDGLGLEERFDEDIVIPDRDRSIADGAIAPWKTLTSRQRQKWIEQLQPVMEQVGLELRSPLKQLSPAGWKKFLNGTDESTPGLMLLLMKEWSTCTKERRMEELQRYIATLPCQACGGSRLNPIARSVRINGVGIHELSQMPIHAAVEFCRNLDLTKKQRRIADRLLEAIVRRLEFLQRVGVDYLSLGRAADSLSGGELQRVRLATAIGSGPSNVCYILDEPSVGLHHRDTTRLMDAIRGLQNAGNTVVIVEHDDSMIAAADWIIDVGPGAGRHGGEVVATGTIDEFRTCKPGITADYLAGRKRIRVRESRRGVQADAMIALSGATGNNLDDVSVQIPLGVFVCVTGVSGSGKSTLVNQTLVPAVRRALGEASPRPCDYRSLTGIERIDRVVLVDQRPLGRNARSCPATYTGVLAEIRKVFAATRTARQLGFSASRFSFNSKAGQCSTCRGHGVRRLSMNFLPDAFTRCETCRGRRFNLQTLQVQFAGWTIADVLEMPIEDAVDVFAGFEKIHRVLKTLVDVGVGYLSLGQSSSTLSGGENQRVKLARELSTAVRGHTLYVLDEPTTGLHVDDVGRLLEVLHRLVDAGNSVIVIEHQLDVIRSADWIIDLGPEGGERGGTIVVAGTPDDVQACEASHTGAALRSTAGNRNPSRA